MLKKTNKKDQTNDVNVQTMILGTSTFAYLAKTNT